jgi:hypothetical protein
MVNLHLPKPLKLLRLFAYFSFVFLLVSLLAARSLYAHARDAALALGHELAGLGPLTRGGHTLNLNGARVN